MSSSENKKPAYDENLFLILLPGFIFLCLATLIMVLSIVEVKPSRDPFPEPTLTVEESAALIAPVTSGSSGGGGSSGAPGNVGGNEGLALISKSDCVACHKDTVKVLGPSYADVAAKYKGDKTALKKLMDKVKLGGAGVWGPIPMSPHPTLKDDELEKMVKYILSLKGGKAPEAVAKTDLNEKTPEVLVDSGSEHQVVFEMMKTKSDCYVCHKDRELMIGPSFLEISKKYKDSKDKKVIVEKIKKGGVGVWGQVPMIAHPQIADEEIEKMVNAILSIQ